MTDQETFGGIDMIVRRNAFGRQNESFEAAVDVTGIPGGPVEGVFIRAPWVESVGGAVEVLATYGGHIVAVRQGDVARHVLPPGADRRPPGPRALRGLRAQRGRGARSR